jgi:predicted amidohydrolase
LKAGVAQIDLDDKTGSNAAKLCRYIRSAAGLKLDLLCFPECSLTGYRRDFNKIDWDEVARALDELQGVAAEEDITIVVGTPYLEADKIYNAALVISANYRLKYFKNNLTDFDKQYFARGQGILTFEVKGIKCGLLICRDQNYPRLAREYARAGTAVLFFLAAHYYPPDEAYLKLEKNRALPIARAVENRFFVAKANAVGSRGGCISLGHSMMVDPDGLIICEADEKQETLLYHQF